LIRSYIELVNTAVARPLRTGTRSYKPGPGIEAIHLQAALASFDASQNTNIMSNKPT